MRFCKGCTQLDKRLKNPCRKGFDVRLGKTGEVIRSNACKVKFKPSKLDTDSGLNDALDIAWSKAVRAKGYCEHCGKILEQKKLQAHHIFSRRHYSTRWDIDNSVCLCYGCHIEWAHKDVMEFAEWVEGYKGKELIEHLRLKAHALKQFNSYEKKELLKYLQSQNNLV